ncbi:hypothetical protein D9M68_701470 [compost metagenome]
MDLRQFADRTCELRCLARGRGGEHGIATTHVIAEQGRELGRIGGTPGPPQQGDAGRVRGRVVVIVAVKGPGQPTG